MARHQHGRKAMHWRFAHVFLLVHVSVSVADGQPIVWPSPHWEGAQPSDVGMDLAGLEDAKRYALSAGGSGMVVRRGKVVLRWGDQTKRYDIKSATKSFGATMLGIAVKDGKIELNAPARRYHSTLDRSPESNPRTGWLDEITILHLATQTAGFAKPGGYERLLFRPGTQWHYSDGGPNWLAECITLQYQRDLEDVMFDRVFTPLGISRDDLRWRKNQYREHEIEGVPRREFGAGIHANVEALSRLGYMYLRQGQWEGEQILTKEFVDMASRPVKSLVGLPEWSPASHGNASDHYGLLWWNNVDGTLANVPCDAFWAWGLYDSLIVVIPSLDLVVARGGERGRQWQRRDGDNHYHVLEPFLNPVVASVESPQSENSAEQTSSHSSAPCPPSTTITGIEWASSKSIIRLAEGSDNWPMTWADDGQLYSAYGDGWGFPPKVEKKLSLGLVRVQGSPPNIQGFNVRSDDAEQVGQGANGVKASGMLMVDGVLYMLVRNAGNAQLMGSEDHGTTWTRAHWKWTVSFGCPTFLNFGRNYDGARDDHVYIYSHDSDSAYEHADRMVMARVHRESIRRRAAYEFFHGLGADGNPLWSKNIGDRKAVFVNPGGCYRSGISYNAGLQRYLWCQVLPHSDDKRGPRFQGGFGIYESPEPWGPWRTVFFTEDWDVGPGETSNIPTKWISHDGKTIHLVFSGDDYFSVRKATLTVK